MEFFEYPQGLTMTGEGFARVFGGPARKPEAKLTQREMDLARSIQDITEEVMLKMTGFAHRETGMYASRRTRRRGIEISGSPPTDSVSASMLGVPKHTRTTVGPSPF